jgi:chaperone modulatory protein CbpM
MGTEELIIIEVFCQEYQIETNFIQDLEEYGLITTTIHEEKKYLNTNQLVYNDLNINKEGIDVILQLQEKEEQLLKEIKNLKNRLGLYE